jgi:hypothetical protein
MIYAATVLNPLFLLLSSYDDDDDDYPSLYLWPLFSRTHNNPGSTQTHFLLVLRRISIVNSD